MPLYWHLYDARGLSLGKLYFMNTAINKNLAHESESQRQYARIKIPARVIVEVDGKLKKYPLLDLSAGGFAFQGALSATENGYRGRIEFNVDGFVFMMPINFDVKQAGRNGRIGCCFQNMSGQETASLRHIITAFLSGELVTSGDMINILGRDNFAKTRSNKDSQALAGMARLKAVVGSLLFLCAGLAAFSFVALKLWSVLFVLHSQVAVVNTDSYLIKTPREGVVDLLVTSGQQVKAGQILGTFASPLVSFLGDAINVEKMPSESIQSLMAQSYAGSLVSPCDCTVGPVLVTQGQYADKGEAVLSLVVNAAVPYVWADFAAADIDSLAIDKLAKVRVAGTEYTGKITKVEVVKDANGQLTDVVSVMVRSAELGLTDAIGMPATVSIAKYDFAK